MAAIRRPVRTSGMRPATPPGVPVNPMRYGTNARRVPPGYGQVPTVSDPINYSAAQMRKNLAEQARANIRTRQPGPNQLQRHREVADFQRRARQMARGIYTDIGQANPPGPGQRGYRAGR